MSQNIYQIEPIWSGRIVVVIAGGPSLTAAQVRRVAMARLDDKCRVIVVNDAVYLAWWADWLHAYDRQWWKWHIDRVQHFRGIKTTVDEFVPASWVTGRLVMAGKAGFDPDPHRCRGPNSGYQAVHCAIHTAPRRVLLLGFDSSEGHWFAGHPDGKTTDLAAAASTFDDLAAAARARDIQIINCSPSTNIQSFQRGDIEALL